MHICVVQFTYEEVVLLPSATPDYITAPPLRLLTFDDFGS
jgi:hypothetical protein